MRRTFSASMLALLVTSMFTLALGVQLVRTAGMVYIRADGSIDPPDAPIFTLDNVTYAFTDSINDSLVVERNHVIVDGNGHTLQGTGTIGSIGIDLFGRTNVTVRNTQIKAFETGIRLDHSSSNKISGNTVTANDVYGIYLSSSSDNVINENNVTTSNHIGICLSYSSNNTVERNNAAGNSDGVYVDHGSNNTLNGNYVAENAHHGICLSSLSAYNIVVGNSLTNNSFDGILVQSSPNNLVSGNNVTANKMNGIRLYSSSYDNIVSQNNVVANNQYGICLFFSSNNNTISENNVTMSGICNIYVYSSANNTVNGNNATANHFGVWLDSSSNNNITANNIANNSYGLLLYSSSNNTIYHNSFTWNSLHTFIYSTSLGNVWNDTYPSGGNYWSNYTGADSLGGPYQNISGSDGIGDQSHFIDINNTDNYPIMHPYGAVRNLDTNLTYLTIQSAINAPETLNGHTILAKAETYYEHVVVDKSISLVGENRDTTVIDGNGTGTAVLVEANNSIVTGFLLQSGGWLNSGIMLNESCNSLVYSNKAIDNWFGIFLKSSSNCSIYDNDALGNCVGIELVFSSNCSVQNNNVKNNTYGVELDRVQGCSIHSNNVRNNTWDGIRLDGSSDCLLRNNSISGNSCNLWLQGTTLEHYIHDIDTSNTVNNRPIHYLVNRSDAVIEPSAFPNIGYLALINSTNIAVRDVILTEPNGQGMLFAFTRESTISNTTVKNNWYGIDLSYSSNISIHNSVITANQWGIYSYSSSNCSICNNTITANSVNGIHFYESSNQNSIYANVISYNGRGVYVEHSSNNKFYSNDFKYNGEQVRIVPSGYINSWDDGYPLGGNYWSGYSGVDLCSGPYQNETGCDGIGDMLYVLATNNTDRYPLMNPHDAPRTYSLTITTTAGGTTSPTPGSHNCAPNSSTLVTAIPEANYLFDHWELDTVNVGSANPYSVLMDSNHTFCAVFRLLTYKLTILNSTEGTTNPAAGIYTYTNGTNVAVTATPTTYYILDYWLLDGNNAGSANPTTVLMTADHTLQPVFARTNYALTISATVGGVTDPIVGMYVHSGGTIATVSASPSSGYKFDHWILDGFPAGSDNPTNILMDSNHTLHAVFAENHTLLITASDGGTTNPIPGTYIHDNPINASVQAIPNANYYLDHWIYDGANIGSQNPITVYVGSSHHLQAVFSLINHTLTITASVGGTTDPVPGTYFYINGTQASVAAIPDTYFVLEYWLLDGVNVGSANPYSVLMDSDHTLHAIFMIHDVAVKDVALSKTVIGQGFSLCVNVTVSNQGSCAETFNVTVYANTTVIGTQTVSNLLNGTSTVLTFTWNTAGFVNGNYTISACAESVPSELDTGDNDLTGGWVILALAGDITGPNGWPDGRVDMWDVGNVARRFMAQPPSPDYNPNFDINDDGTINMIDIGTVARHFGEHHP